ncbi:LANO_0A04434g1_1 [Lachancea nothofagi CBS 11611]|uniref:LANO_0A04434g1_1 n=1 Tax=Lachancea nothofagi CBS 11611 TaxID=1266666 RepID=A0A1G4IQD4_9SACH|nr:LANO_0A04434g1_1 [Lachancea nothofagi CBS 11611]
MRSEYSLLISTFNCGKCLPLTEPSQLEKIASILVSPDFVHDIYVLGFQELVAIWQGSFPDIVETQLLTLSYAILKRINALDVSREFKLVALNSVGAIGLLVYVDTKFITTNILKASARCGLLFSSLKGATAVKLTLQAPDSENFSSFVFVTAHLAANEGEEHLLRRENDYHAVTNALEQELGPFAANHVFICGDLNFRSGRWATGETDFSNTDYLREAVRQHDELSTSKGSGRIFKNFQEAPISFAPTYKFQLTTPKESYNPSRIPSWCDRVLFQNGPVKPKILSYTSCKRSSALQFTDHLPVVLQVIVPYADFDSSVSSLIVKQASTQGSRTIGRLVDLIIGYSGRATDLYGTQLVVAGILLALWVIYLTCT